MVFKIIYFYVFQQFSEHINADVREGSVLIGTKIIMGPLHNTILKSIKIYTYNYYVFNHRRYARVSRKK